MTANGIKFVSASGRGPYAEIMNSKYVQDLLLAKAERVSVKALNGISKIGHEQQGNYAHAVKRANYQLTWDVRPGRHRAHAMVKLDVRTPRYGTKDYFRDVGHNRKWGPYVSSVLIQALDTLGGEFN